MEGFRDRIIAITSPGVAAEDAADGEIETLEDAVLQNGFNGILGAGGGEAAGGRCQRGDESLIETDGEDEETAQGL